SLVATHLAAQSLLRGECDIALVGGVTIASTQGRGYLYQEGGIVSPDGHCRAFDARARGTIPGSGAGIVVLKRLSAALADGDVVHAVIKGSAINNDGSDKVGYTAPSVEGQAAVIAEALAMAGVEPQTVGYVEAHGTATPLGDPIEITALHQAFGTEPGRRCALGSVKTNVGHLDTAAGVAGLIKTVLALEHRQIPPSLHFAEPNPEIDFDEGPFYVNAALAPWPRVGREPRRAGVSSFGIGGTNAHLILEEAPLAEPSGPSRPWQLLVLSAATAPALDALTARFADDLRDHPDKSLADVAFTCQVGRRRLPYRRALVCRGGEEAVAALENPSERALDGCEERDRRGLVYLFSGLGDHYPGMGRGLYEAEPVFRTEVDRCCELLEPLLGLDLRQVLYPAAVAEEGQETSGPDLRRLLGRAPQPASEAHRRLAETRLAQPAVFVVEVALARLLRSWGIVPQAMIGYSLGEYTAAHVAGVLSLEEAVTLVVERAELISTLPAGAMVAVTLSAAEVEPLLGEELSLAATNAPEVSVVAGPEEAVARFEEELAAAGRIFQRLQTRHAFHSSMMEPIADALGERVRRCRLRAPEIPFLSNVTGTWITAAEAVDPEYWVRHLCQPVRFTEGLGELFRDPEPVLLEVGPGQALATAARQHPERKADQVVLASLGDERDRHSDQAFLLRALGQLWLAGSEIDWRGFYAGERRRRVALPTYPFERRRFWIEPGTESLTAWRQPPAFEKRQDVAKWFYVPEWKPSELSATAAEVEGRWLLFVDECGLGAELERQLTAAGAAVVTVRPGDGFARLADGSYAVRPAERA
ncbi:MAG: type I polyketide synthase, partial [bacterium]|nr:type I polyketide synthase [bacterium]